MEEDNKRAEENERRQEFFGWMIPLALRYGHIRKCGGVILSDKEILKLAKRMFKFVRKKGDINSIARHRSLVFALDYASLVSSSVILSEEKLFSVAKEIYKVLKGKK